MIAAASAFPLLLFAQIAQTFFQYDLHVGGAVIFADRAIFVASLGLYAAWLTAASKAPDWCAKMLALSTAAGILAIFLERPLAIPIIWLLQAAILVALLLWAYAERGNRWVLAFLLVASGAHAIGALTIYPLCQIGAPADMMALPAAGYVCNAVIGEVLAALLPAGIGAVAWAAAVSGAIMARKV